MVSTTTELRETMPASNLANMNSSQRLVAFLEDANLHKKDFAEMIGVTLSYVYSLIDENIAFSTRTTTLERVAVVMETDPETFPEYKRPEEPRLVDQGIEFDPLAAPAPDLTLDLEHRPIGGLGILLLKTLAGSLSYRREQGWNHLRFGISANS